MKNNDIMYALSPTSRYKMLKVRFLGRSSRGNLRIKWLQGSLKNREALLPSNSLRKNKWKNDTRE